MIESAQATLQHVQLSLRLVFSYFYWNFPTVWFLRESPSGEKRFIFQGIVLDFHFIYLYCVVHLPKLRLVFARIVIRIFARLLWNSVVVCLLPSFKKIH